MSFTHLTSNFAALHNHSSHAQPAYNTTYEPHVSEHHSIHDTKLLKTTGLFTCVLTGRTQPLHKCSLQTTCNHRWQLLQLLSAAFHTPHASTPSWVPQSTSCRHHKTPEIHTYIHVSHQPNSPHATADNRNELRDLCVAGKCTTSHTMAQQGACIRLL